MIATEPKIPIKNFSGWNEIQRNLVYMILFGIVSAVLGFVEFKIPGLENAGTDLREAPILISLFFITNPVYTIGVSLISAAGLLVSGTSPFGLTFIYHAISLSILSFLYLKIKELKLNGWWYSISWFALVVIYYLVLIIPSFIAVYQLAGYHTEKSFTQFYTDLFVPLKYELLTSLLIVILFAIQFHIRERLNFHLENLEWLVQERTSELATMNEELESANTELQAQKEELTAINTHLQDTQSALVQSEKMAALGTLTSGIAHEINNPLNYIVGGVCGLEDYLATHNLKDETAKFLIDAIKTGANRATAIVEAMHRLAGSGNNEFTHCFIETLIENCLKELENQLHEGIKIVKNFSQNAKQVFIGEANIMLAITNILSNAIHSIHNQGSIQISTTYENDLVCIQITDSGTGISRENLLKVTDPFFTTKDPGKGIGLGLPIAYSIIKEHKGDLKIQSEVNVGTSVYVYLPI